MEAAGPSLVHGTAISVSGRAALIRGAPGWGKSDLALRCLLQPPSAYWKDSAALIADDQVRVEPRDGGLKVSCPKTIRGLIEVRGIGILTVPFVEEADLDLVVDLVAPGMVERMPPPDATADVLGAKVRRIALAPFEASAPLKVLLMLGGHAARK